MSLNPLAGRYTASLARIATKDNYISTLDIHKPEVAEDFVQRYGSQNLTGLLEMIGSKAAVAATSFSHYEENYIHNFIQASAAASSAAKLQAVKIDADVAIETGATPQKVSSVRLNDVVMLASGRTAIVAGINRNGKAIEYLSGWTSGLTAGNSTKTQEEILLVAYDDTNFTVADNEVLAIIGNEHAEATGQPKGLTPTPIKYTNNTIILKEAFEVSGTEATNVSWMKVEGADGKEGFLWYLKGENDTYKRFQNYCEMMMLVGEKAAGANATAGMKGTEGLLTHIQSTGTTVDTSATFVKADVDDMVKALDRERGSKQNAFYCGIDLSIAVDNAIAEFNSSTVNSGYGSFVNGEDMITLGFTNFNRAGYSFSKSVYDPFNYSAMLGASAADYATKGFVVPMDSQRDAKSGDKIPSLRVRFKEAGAYSREMEHWLTGSAVLDNPTDEVDILRCNYRTERGLEVFGGNRFLFVK
jgi:hypothetical protein